MTLKGPAPLSLGLESLGRLHQETGESSRIKWVMERISEGPSPLP